MQERRNSIANALELHLSCTNRLICSFMEAYPVMGNDTSPVSQSNQHTGYKIRPHAATCHLCHNNELPMLMVQDYWDKLPGLECRNDLYRPLITQVINQMLTKHISWFSMRVSYEVYFVSLKSNLYSLFLLFCMYHIILDPMTTVIVVTIWQSESTWEHFQNTFTFTITDYL